MITFTTIITASPYVPIARQLAEGIAGNSGDNMWACPLSPTGQEPATHYCSSGFISEGMAELLTNPEGIVSASQGLVSLELAGSIVSNSDVSDEEAQEAFSRLGLVQVISSSGL